MLRQNKFELPAEARAFRLRRALHRRIIMTMNTLSNKRGNIALLVARLIIGGIFINAGWMKVSDLASTVQFFGTLGIPAFLAYAVSFIELIGGVMLVLGLWTCLAAFVLSIIMLFAIWFTRMGGMGAFGTPLAVFAGLISLFGSCGGCYSLTHCCKNKTCATETPKM